jgi:type II secretory ATPase GspE/PulE/Tfp pilus assembly ATPase PilB-like protein
MNGVICRKCGGKGCKTCNHTGYKGGIKVKKTFHTPSGGTYTREVKGGKTAKKARKGKATKATGGGVTHKAYSYTTKKGKTVHVASHVEHPHRKAK